MRPLQKLKKGRLRYIRKMKGCRYCQLIELYMHNNMRHLKDWDIADGKMVIHVKYCMVEITVLRSKSEKIKEILRKNYIFKAKKSRPDNSFFT